jgi:methanogenic corrinoid protein MtbC1
LAEIEDNETTRMMGIGAMSRATGVPVETLRTWERRYGFPKPERTPTGRRVYGAENVEHIRWIKKALDAGHRPGQVMGASRSELKALLGPLPGLAKPGDTSESSDGEAPIDFLSWMPMVTALEQAELDLVFRRTWSRVGTLRFLTEGVGPFLTEMGDAWTRGELTVAHEHFASERLRDFLTSLWRPLSEVQSGAPLVLASLPGEHHHLGLHMAASVAALHRQRIVFLGMDTPLDAIAQATEQVRARAVLVSVSQAMDLAVAQASLRALKKLLAKDVRLVVGGQVEGLGVDDIALHTDLHGLEDWIRAN